MIKTLIIHLGDTKTGSSALQSVLRAGAYKTPNGQTICYPGKYLHHNRLPKAFSKTSKGPPPGKLFQKIAEEFRDSDADYGIISAELFQDVGPVALHRVLKAEMPEFMGDMRLISYVRPHAERLVSTFSERARIGAVTARMSDHLQAMQKSKRLDFMPRFTAWRKTFGDQFSLRLFHKDHLKNGDVVDDFFCWMIGTMGTEISGVQQSNASLSVGQVALMHRFYDLLPEALKEKAGGKIQPGVARLLVDQFRSTGLGADMERIVMPQHLATRLQSRFKRDARMLDAAFFEGTPMSDALTSIPPKLIGGSQEFDAAALFSQETLQAFDAMSLMTIYLLESTPTRGRVIRDP